MRMVLTVVVFAARGANLISNGAFEEGMEAWSMSLGEATVSVVEEEGRPAAELAVPEHMPLAYPNLRQEFPAREGDIFCGEVEARRVEGINGYGAYLSMEFYDDAGTRLGFSQSDAAEFDGVWTRLETRAQAPSQTASVRLLLLLNGHGKARFRDAALTELAPPREKPLRGPVTIDVTERIACESLIGFGFEDDGWFYNRENAEHGVTEDDIALRERRIAWMAPDWVRMFFWYEDWCPSGDWSRFTFDSDNMRSHYRTLDLYQRLGAAVNVVGVEWGMRDVYRDPERAAWAIGELLEYLIRGKGYTCVRYWTLTNEPHLWFLQHSYPFDRYVEMHQLVRAEILNRGLDIRIVGSDDTNGGWGWFQRCVADDRYFAAADLFASHRYLSFLEQDLAQDFFRKRLDLLATREPKKPFVVAEFGFHDHRSSVNRNPIMQTYPYAIWSAAFAIRGLNQGTAGFSIWCLHEKFYPGSNRMGYGLWDWKDNDWKPRPVYHVWSMFTRLTRAGDAVRSCQSSHPQAVEAVRVGDILFWVNRRDQPTTIRVAGMRIQAVRAMYESILTGDRESEESAKVARGRFTAPPMSFGYAR
mgnify:CR=1 FL=1